MKLLVITQKVDQEDGVLGYFHWWLEKFAASVDFLTVICLFEGKHQLPENVKVLSLGKESGRSKVKYLKRFYKYVWQERHNYDAVFVHMNQEYVLLAAPLWRLLGKNVALWYNHKIGTWRTRLAVVLANVVFYTSPQAFMSRYKKAQQMPTGIDTDHFSFDASERDRSKLLSIGRISPVKKVEMMVEAASTLARGGEQFSFDIYGPVPDEDRGYYESLQGDLPEQVAFKPLIKPEDLAETQRQYGYFVNVTQAGSFDKTIFEALSSGTVVVTSNPALKDVLGEKLICQEGDAESLAESLRYALNLSSEEYNEVARRGREYIENNHSLNQLIKSVLGYLRP